jgi:hypothetical protein
MTKVLLLEFSLRKLGVSVVYFPQRPINHRDTEKTKKLLRQSHLPG